MTKHIKSILIKGLSIIYCIPAVADEVKLFTWEEFISPEVLKNFEKETGHTVTEFYLDNEEKRDALLISGRGERFDLVVIDSQSLKTEGKRKYFTTITEREVPNLKHLSTEFRQACGEMGLPYAWGTIGLAYRRSANPEGIDSWMQLFNLSPENKQKTIMLGDSLDGTIIALTALGLPPFSQNKEDLKQAYALLKQQKPNLHSYGYGLSHAIDSGADSDITLAVTFSGDTEQFIQATGQSDWTYTVPKEGAMIWTDCLAVPYRSEKIKPATVQFLNYINRPDVAALNAETTWFATPNKSALKHTSKIYNEDTELFPDEQIKHNGFYYQSLPNEQLKLRSRMMQKLQPYNQ